MGCNCGKKPPVVINPQPTPEVIKTETNGESETSSTGTDSE